MAEGGRGVNNCVEMKLEREGVDAVVRSKSDLTEDI